METLKQFFNNQSAVSPEAWEVIRAKFTEFNFKKNEYLIREGQHAAYKFFIAKGITRTFYIKEGKEITVDFNFENTFVDSYASFLTGNPSRCYIQALEQTKCYKIKKENLNQLYSDYKLGERLGRIIVEKRLLDKELREATLLLDSPKERFLWLQENHKDWLQRIPQQHLASYIGISPETYSRYKKAYLNQ